MSKRSCLSDPGNTAIDGNLFIGSSLTLERPELTVSGAIEISVFSTRSAATIFAGGDIILGTIAAEGPLLLISATGEVVVKASTVPGMITAISPRAVYLPPGAAAPAFGGTLPQQLPFIVLGRSTD